MCIYIYIYIYIYICPPQAKAHRTTPEVAHLQRTTPAAARYYFERCIV